MATYQLVPSLVKLRSEFNEMGPVRDKSSDGWIGDARHAASVSDHNPAPDGDVHAIDVDMSGPWLPGMSMERMVQYIVGRCRTGKERRLKYVIYNRRIWAASNNWDKANYYGTNPHDHHAHFSASYSPVQESNTTSWRLADLLPPVDPNPEVPIVTQPVPSAQQNADAIAGRDIDPSENRYSWAGADFTTFIRTARIGPMADVVDDIAARVEDQSDTLNALTGALTVIAAQNAEILKRLSATGPIISP